MIKDYFFISPTTESYDLDDRFALPGEQGESRYLVANTRDVEAEVHAPEINFYLARTLDDRETQRDHITRLYEARTIGFDLSLQTERVLPTGRGGTGSDHPDDGGEQRIRTSIIHIPSLCEYHHRRTGACHTCVDRCPAKAVRCNPASLKLEFSEIDCTGCGLCVSSCPTGALEFAPLPRNSWQRISGLYQGRVAMVIGEETDFPSLSLQLVREVLPLVVPVLDFLDEAHLLTLLASGGRPILFFGRPDSSATCSAIELINTIFDAIYGRPAVFVVEDGDDLAALTDRLAPFSGLPHNLDERSLTKRWIFAGHLARLVGSKDHGTVACGAELAYATLDIDRDSCTLCLACADICRSQALTVHPEDNSLRFQASRCTACGSCQATCPEESLNLKRGEIDLAPAFFTEKELARDELFACIECGAGFAPAKAVNKIIAMMQPAFGDDQRRIRSLSCCPDCKAKVMLQNKTS